MRKFISFAMALLLASSAASAEQLLPNGSYVTVAREATAAVLDAKEKQDIEAARPYFTREGWKNRKNTLAAASITDRETGEVIAPADFDISDITSAGVVSTRGRERVVKMKISNRSDSRYKGYTVTVVMTEEDDEAKIEQMTISPGD